METTPNGLLLRHYYNATIPELSPVIPATQGNRTIPGTREVFNWGIGAAFKELGLLEGSEATAETHIGVFGISDRSKDRDFGRKTGFPVFFGSFGKPLDTLCLTQDQIIAFCEHHKDKLLHRKDWGNFFLTKRVSDNKLFVISVEVRFDGLIGSDAHEFETLGGVRPNRKDRIMVDATAL